MEQIKALFVNNPITTLFGIDYPIVSGGMVWCSGHELASAVTLSGGLGLIGAGSMRPEVLREHIRKCKVAVGEKAFGVNIPLMYKYAEEHIRIVLEEHVPVVFTSAGNPKTWTSTLKEEGIKVAHVVSSAKFALKSEDAGVDAVVAEGFEAGGHNGREETTTLCLIPSVAKAVHIPLLAAGGIASGEAMAATFCLGAKGVQIGTAFALTKESSAHPNFKEYCLGLQEGDTRLMFKKVSPTRLSKGPYYNLIADAEARGASPEELKEIKGEGRARIGLFEGDLENGELEIGQIASEVNRLLSVSELMREILEGYNRTVNLCPSDAGKMV